ncbi:helix-hairpin-helix domain-containing protein [Paenibacillus sp. P96]|uniref:Helix-hairpin-helix domain-containing protein n=1 Tax=Paenibacillus zeirhizosphaerae TaxID=2987519 RepID=A0ABT9FQK5_9BACL|nr:helix-hairpin-helix domain-containing protein [Paenibacillus sp. P96]MDP4097028.1 helix-hairpin-helix domain-containing protein [Paenibacillus sp. P96]
MKRVMHAVAVALAVAGSGLILFSGNRAPEPEAGWTPLNPVLEKRVAEESKPVTDTSKETSAPAKTDEAPVGSTAKESTAEGTSTAAEQPVTKVAQTQTVEAPAGAEVSVPPSAEGQMVNINSASAAELMELPGIGEKKAQAIVEYRNAHGPFKQPEDLEQVKGIGPKMLLKMKPYIKL